MQKRGKREEKILYSKYIHKRGHYFLDIQYIVGPSNRTLNPQLFLPDSQSMAESHFSCGDYRGAAKI